MVLMIEFLHDLMNQKARKYGTIVRKGLCRISVISSRLPFRDPSPGR